MKFYWSEVLEDEKIGIFCDLKKTFDAKQSDLYIYAEWKHLSTAENQNNMNIYKTL